MLADSAATFHMTKSAELLRDVRPSDDKVKIGDNTLIDVKCYGSLTVVFPNKAGGVTVRLERVAYVPDLAFNLFSLMAAHTRGVSFTTDDSDKSVTLLDGRLRFWSDGTGYSMHMVGELILMMSAPPLPRWYLDLLRIQCNLTPLFPWRSL